MVRKSSDRLGVASPREGMVTFAATEGTEVKSVILVEGRTLGDGISTLNVPVDAKGLVVRSGEARTRATFCPDGLPISKFCRGGFEVEENSVLLVHTDEADGRGGRLASAWRKGLRISL